MRVPALLSLLALMLLASSCPGSEFVPLPPGSGQGDYVGRFTNDDESEIFGEFELTVDENGAVDGDGLLNGRQIDIEGILSGSGELTGFLTDRLTQLGGTFDGNLVSNTIIGDFRMQQLGGDADLEGLWDAALQQ
ncbi:hypothetical protein IT575_00665 [bacterium]|nr:hypothetical protein [bacterium]